MFANEDSAAWFGETVVPFLYSAADEAEAFVLDEPGEKRLRQSYLPKAAAAAVHAVAPKSRNTTYGEVLPQSIWKHVISAMNLQVSDVFYDIGSGTGKIPLQVALQAGCVAKGVEFVAARHAIGTAALDRCKNWTQQHDDDCIGNATTKREVAATLARVQLIEGDACDPSIDLHDATAIFINNVLFQPDLMDRIVARLATLPKLRTLVTLRRICSRHRETTCGRKMSPCCAFQHPAEASGEVWPSWDKSTTMFVYRRVPRITDYFSVGKRAGALEDKVSVGVAAAKAPVHPSPRKRLAL